MIGGLDPGSQVLSLRVSLGGEWSFRLDPEEYGERDRWDRETTPFEDRIRVPGAGDA